MERAEFTAGTLSNEWPSASTLYRWARKADDLALEHMFHERFAAQAGARAEAEEYRRQARAKTALQNARLEQAFLRLCKKRR